MAFGAVPSEGGQGTFGQSGGTFGQQAVTGYGGAFGAPQAATKPRPQSSWAPAIVNELIKSYGGRVDQDWNLSWSVENIGEAFEESPVWTTIDWLTLGVPIAKWGRAAALAHGAVNPASALGKLTAGSIRKLPGTTQARLAEGLNYEGAYAAVRAAGPTSKIGRLITNPLTETFGEPRGFMRAHADPGEIRGLHNFHKRQKDLAVAVADRRGNDAIALIDKLGKSFFDDVDEMSLWDYRMSTGITPEDLKAMPGMDGAYARAYEKSFNFRNDLHQRHIKSEMISLETGEAMNQKWNPRMYEEFFGKSAASKHLKQRKHREGPAEHLTQILDPRLAMREMMRISDVTASHEFAIAIGNSAVAADASSLLGYMEKYIGDPRMYSRFKDVFGFDKGQLGVIQEQLAVVKRLGLDGTSAEAEKIFRDAGWKQVKHLVDSTLEKDIGWTDKFPKALRDQWIDPAVQGEIGSLMQFGKEGPANYIGDMMKRAYNASMGLFRTGKTAYNPGTHVRNFFGGIVYHNLATGSLKMFPDKGFKSYIDHFAKGAENRDVLDALNHGVIGSSFMEEIRLPAKLAAALKGVDWKATAKLEGGRKTSLDFLGDSRLAKHMQDAGAKAEDIYRAEDEIWKLEAFINNTKKFTDRGMSREAAMEAATLQVAKFMPQFSSHSPVGDMLRKGIPFASFTNEALRIWKNTMIEKPHMAFGWSHFTESATYAIGAASGFSSEEVDNAKANLPDFQQNKRMLLLPFMADDKPQFLDMSYLIPLANIGEAAESENLFLGAFYDPTTNPLINIAAAAGTGIDPFTKRPIAPNFTEKFGGPVIANQNLRKLVGLLEHTATVMLPPLAPPGYAAANLMELAKGEVNPQTGQPYEPDYVKTIAANLLGMRTYEGTVLSQLQNARREDAKLGEEMKIWRDAAKRSRANGDTVGMNEALDKMRNLRVSLNPGDDPDVYIEKFLKNSEPGKFRGTSTRHLQEAVSRSARLPVLSSEDRSAVSELSARLRERQHGRRSGRSSGRTGRSGRSSR